MKIGETVARIARGKVVAVKDNRVLIEWASGKTSWTYIAGLVSTSEEDFATARREQLAKKR